MWLINCATLRLEEFFESEAPKYGVLSHTWGRKEEEVTFREIADGLAVTKAGYDKIKNCARLSTSQGLSYCWIDTCCIDKSSSADLSEAINSMYRWYQHAEICFVYLNDYSEATNSVDGEVDDMRALPSAISQCRWFTRGWTLQELIAPSRVHFYDENWRYIGRKAGTQNFNILTSITGINRDVLGQTSDLSDLSAATKMSWAAERQTTRKEDEAYCLLGLFGINMPLLYGEGDHAFQRLQEEILRRTEDLSLLAWNDNTYRHCQSLLADGPIRFAHAAGATFFTSGPSMAPTMTSQGLQLRLGICTSYKSPGSIIGLLPCQNSVGSQLAIRLGTLDCCIKSQGRFWRLVGSEVSSTRSLEVDDDTITFHVITLTSQPESFDRFAPRFNVDGRVIAFRQDMCYFRLKDQHTNSRLTFRGHDGNYAERSQKEELWLKSVYRPGMPARAEWRIQMGDNSSSAIIDLHCGYARAPNKFYDISRFQCAARISNVNDDITQTFAGEPSSLEGECQPLKECPVWMIPLNDTGILRISAQRRGIFGDMALTEVDLCLLP